jgi:hypothetical protein
MRVHAIEKYRVRNEAGAMRSEAGRSGPGQGVDNALACSAASTADEDDEFIEHKALDNHLDLFGIEI